MGADTKQRILDTAERLFGQQGYSSTSLRQIINEAGVNLAAVHYHFGSKQELLDDLVMRKAQPVNEARLAGLDRLEAEANGDPIAVEKILDAFLAPTAEAADRDPQFVKMMGRLIAEDLLAELVERHFQGVLTRMTTALRRSLSNLPDDEFIWRLHFMIGAMAHTMRGGPDPTHVGQSGAEFRERIPRLVTFLAGGFRAPAAKPQETALGGRAPLRKKEKA
jgi:AcrR family transcriptional regulator